MLADCVLLPATKHVPGLLLGGLGKSTCFEPVQQSWVQMWLSLTNLIYYNANMWSWIIKKIAQKGHILG